MNAPEILTTEILAGIIVVAAMAGGLLCLAVAMEWIRFSLSIATVPASKRQRRVTPADPDAAP